MEPSAETPAAWAQLAAAIQADDPAALRAAFAAHPGLAALINEPLPGDEFGATPLIIAARRNARPVVSVLLEHGADLAARSRWWAGGFSALDHAPPQMAAWLIEQGAPVDVVTAARLGLLDRVRQAVAADPRAVHQRGGDGQTALHAALTVEIAEFLLDHGAPIDARDVDHESTPAQYALGDRREVARLLVARGCRTDLLMAAALGDRARAAAHLAEDPESIRLAVSQRCFPKLNPAAGGSIYIWTLGRHTSAHDLARRNADQPLLAILMAASPPILQLGKACEWGDEALVERLGGFAGALAPTLPEDLAKLADAAQANQPAAVELLLRCGWPTAARGEDGATALHWAAFHGNVRAVAALLAAQAAVDATDAEYQGTARDWAIHGSLQSWHRSGGNYREVIDRLLAAGAEPLAPGEDFKGSAEVRAALARSRRA